MLNKGMCETSKNARGVEGSRKCAQTSQKHALDDQLQGASRSKRFETGLMEMQSAQHD